MQFWLSCHSKYEYHQIHKHYQKQQVLVILNEAQYINKETQSSAIGNSWQF